MTLVDVHKGLTVPFRLQTAPNLSETRRLELWPEILKVDIVREHLKQVH